VEHGLTTRPLCKSSRFSVEAAALETRPAKAHLTAVSQADLFRPAAAEELPLGFRYQPELIERAEERRLIAEFEKLEFAPFEFQGFLGKRRVISFGWRYDFNKGGLHKAGDIPEFLWPARERAAKFASLKPEDLQHVLLTEYPPGSTIGWHKDRPQFDDVIGISLLSPCTFRFRRKVGAKWERRSFTAEPRSAYLLRGPVRTEWEHSIPAVDAQRYSITFRSLK
jgi:alkylated DNA repair dioxygenase AlkB